MNIPRVSLRELMVIAQLFDLGENFREERKPLLCEFFKKIIGNGISDRV